MNPPQPETPPPPYQERFTTVQPSACSNDAPIQTISYPKPANRPLHEEDDCCADCECNGCIKCLNTGCNVFLCCFCFLECCAAFK